MKLILPDALGAMCIWAEAEGEPYNGKIAVGEVIRNRMRLRYTSDGTVAGTIAKRFQFSFWNDDAVNNARLIRALNLDDESKVVAECMNAWHDSANTRLVPDAVLYYATSIAPPMWATAPDVSFVKTIGKHNFFSVTRP